MAGIPDNSQQGNQYDAAHMEALGELNVKLHAAGKFAIGNNEGDVKLLPSATAMMIEDFAGSEKCIVMLQLAVSRGLAVEARRGACYPPQILPSCRTAIATTGWQRGDSAGDRAAASMYISAAWRRTRPKCPR